MNLIYRYNPLTLVIENVVDFAKLVSFSFCDRFCFEIGIIHKLFYCKNHDNMVLYIIHKFHPYGLFEPLTHFQ